MKHIVRFPVDSLLTGGIINLCPKNQNISKNITKNPPEKSTFMYFRHWLNIGLYATGITYFTTSVIVKVDHASALILGAWIFTSAAAIIFLIAADFLLE